MALKASKKTSRFICNSCGSIYPKWAGKCEGCLEWNTIEEDLSVKDLIPKGLKKQSGSIIEFSSLKSTYTPPQRLLSKIGEFDRVAGGGLVEGSVLLVGGDPGIGKSTLLLQILCLLSQNGYPCAYISGEEATEQIKMRARRLGLDSAPLHLASSTNIADIITTLNHPQHRYKIVVIDSIQTMYIDSIDSAPGTVTQVRACSHELIRAAKQNNLVLLIVGHVTKEGTIAGPRVLEHMVDTVLYFEGDRGHHFRILRSVKNRFGATDEIGVFEMRESGLQEVTNPSAFFLEGRQEDMPGTSVFAGVEGTRPVLLELQSLISPTAYPAPKRSVVGWDYNRLAMILAVLETKCSIKFSQTDVYLNVTGGLKVNEPAADLAAAASLLSALLKIDLPFETILFGEIGLTGEIRGVSQTPQRLNEAIKLGFKEALIPHGTPQDIIKNFSSKIRLTPLKNCYDLLSFFKQRR